MENYPKETRSSSRMAKLPQRVIDAWNQRKGPVVLATVDEKGKPNNIYATCVSRYDDSTIVIANNYFDKTKKNILSGSRGSLLFINEDSESFQIKGEFEYHDSGEIFEDMKSWNPKEHPGHAAVALKVEEVYTGAEKLL
jgi:predicted pyridoxine 5'-phosphate oxidase superfamily flavin-nucleotide-binding protein